jgi:hypothetical protein
LNLNKFLYLLFFIFYSLFLFKRISYLNCEIKSPIKKPPLLNKDFNNSNIKANSNNFGFELEKEKHSEKNDKNSEHFKKIIQPVRKFSEQIPRRKSMDIINANNNKINEIKQIKSDEIKSKIFIFK